MSMDEQDYSDAYAECLGCDQAIFTLGGEDAQAQYVTLVTDPKEQARYYPFCRAPIQRLHKHCRAAYEAEHGPVVCEDDPEPTPPCPSCEGTGEYVATHLPCLTCGGTGDRVPERDEEAEAERRMEQDLEDPPEPFSASVSRAHAEKQDAKGRR